MSGQKYISASCSIVYGEVRKNNKVLYKGNADNAEEFLLSAYKQLAIDYPKFYKMDKLSQLGFLATELLLRANFEKDQYPADRMGVVFANSNASLDADLRYWESVKKIPSPALFVYTLPNIVIGEICIRYGFKGENAFFVQAKFDTAFIEFYVNDLMDRHKLDACICGWVDIVGEDYDAVVYLIERKQDENRLLFTVENINHIYESANG